MRGCMSCCNLPCYRGPVSPQYPAVFDDFWGAIKLKTSPTLLAEEGGKTLCRSHRNIQLEGTWQRAWRWWLKRRERDREEGDQQGTSSAFKQPRLRPIFC